ncbi:hypothetical protein MRO53_21960, partial [Escherichia coli]|nr:hypothetical protein [Escherichia coli]
SVRHIFKPISYLEIQLLSGVSGGYIIFGLGSLDLSGIELHLGVSPLDRTANTPIDTPNSP